MTSKYLSVGAVRRTPAIVVGSGIAGLSAALGLGRCTVITRGRVGGGASRHAQGGIAAALAEQDSPAAHAADTLNVSAGLATWDAAQAITSAAAGRIDWLTRLGARFDRDQQGRPSLGREAGHGARRIIHANGDKTGAEVMRALRAAVRARPAIQTAEKFELVDLLHSGGRVAGVLAYTPDGILTAFVSPVVILATGGIGGLYARTTNPPEVTGDGLAAAIRAGARLADMEFVQFHPTALACDTRPAPLLSEALRGEGAVLIDECGERFMRAVHADAELAPRDVVARAIWQHRHAGHEVFLDAQDAIGDAFPRHFPGIWRIARTAGYDPRREPLPVTPAEHYFMGGIATDLVGQTSLTGLWAVGEVANTGLHGANRLASNSLLEGMVMGAAAARDASSNPVAPPVSARLQAPITAGLLPETGRGDGGKAVQELMWDKAGLVRNARGLRAAVAELDRLEEAAAQTPNLTSRNRVVVARIIVTAALQRNESRGAHYRSDYPARDVAQQRRNVIEPRRQARVPVRLATKQIA